MFNWNWQAIAAIASAIAAACSAYAAYVGPVRAAKIAEEIRQRYQDESDERRVKLHVFANLLGDRRLWPLSVDAVRSLNTIDLAFRRPPDVREAWRSYQRTLIKGNIFPQHEVERREDNLLAEMAKDLGLSQEIRESDLGRFSNPEWRFTVNTAQIRQAQMILAAGAGGGLSTAQASQTDETVSDQR